jgi:preprotein translocase subunit SecA
MAGRGTDILLGGNPEFLANDYLKRDGNQPGRSDARTVRRTARKSQRVVADEHKEVVALAVCTFSARNATNRAASTTSFAVAPVVRAIPVRRVSFSRSKTI